MSAETKHTPGPWQAPDLSKSDSFNVCGLHYYACDPLNVTPEETATASLVAAAPDLLEACKLSLQWMWDNAYEGQPIRELRDAIAKAEGRQ